MINQSYKYKFLQRISFSVFRVHDSILNSSTWRLTICYTELTHVRILFSVVIFLPLTGRALLSLSQSKLPQVNSQLLTFWFGRRKIKTWSFNIIMTTFWTRQSRSHIFTAFFLPFYAILNARIDNTKGLILQIIPHLLHNILNPILTLNMHLGNLPRLLPLKYLQLLPNKK